MLDNLPEVTAERLQIFSEVYIQSNHQDPHTVFAERLKVERHYAKRLSYVCVFQSRFLANLLNEERSAKQIMGEY